MASGTAAIIFFGFNFLIYLVGEYCSILENFFFVCKNEKKVPSRPFFNHLAAGPETESFLVWPQIYTPHERPHLLRLDFLILNGWLLNGNLCYAW